MNSQDLLNIFLIAGLIVIVTCFVFLTYYFVQALKSITQLSDDLGESAQSLKNKLQLKALAAIPAVLVALVGKLLKRGRG